MAAQGRDLNNLRAIARPGRDGVPAAPPFSTALARDLQQLRLMSPTLDLRALKDVPVSAARSKLRFNIGFLPKSLLEPRIVIVLLLILGFGAAIRIWTTRTYTREGQDEHLYGIYVNTIDTTGGITHYRKLIAMNRQVQEGYSQAFVPATRIGFIWPAYACFKVFNVSPIQSLRILSCASGILLLLLAARIGWHAGGKMGMLGLTALMSTAPLHVYLAQRALIDIYFAFWAVLTLWLLWKNLQNKKHWGWLSAYGASLAILVLTKESAAFVFCALLGVLLFSRPLKLGQSSIELVGLTFLAPAVAVAILCLLMGGPSEFLSFFRLLAARNEVSDYAVATQDGPWYRYLIDFTLISPLTLILAIGAIFQLRSAGRFTAFMAIFLGLSFVVMSYVPYGVSLRFATYWDVPLRWLALTQAILLSQGLRKIRPAIALACLLCLICASDLWQYNVYFVKAKLYDPITTNLVYAAGLTKKMPK